MTASQSPSFVYSKIVLSAIIVLCFGAVGVRHVQRDAHAVDLSSSEDVIGPLEDCLKSATLYSRGEQLGSDCTSNYVHYYPLANARSKPKASQGREARSSRPPTPAGAVRIGSFNLFHLGDGQAVAKHLKLVAKLIDRWDVAAVQELMPLPSDYARLNRAIFDVVSRSSSPQQFFSETDWTTPMPGYLQLLHELREVDPSWSLILQSVPEGEGAAGEMSGFFYRGRLVKLKEMPYCPPPRALGGVGGRRAPNIGCLLQVPPEQRRLMSRNAFAAYFQIGSFDFVGVTTHVRYRAADQAAELQAQAAGVCANFPEGAPCKPTKELVGRLYEVKAVADQFAELKRAMRDEDVLYMGDFNIEFNPKTQPYWQSVLHGAPGSKVFQLEPTTVSVRSGKLASNYDHFIFNVEATRECDPQTVRMIDLTRASKSDPEPVLREIAHTLSPDNIQMMIDAQQARIARLVRPVRTAQGFALQNWSEADQKKVFESFVEACGRMKTNIQGAILELISDHMPIEMLCRTSGRDDD